MLAIIVPVRRACAQLLDKPLQSIAGISLILRVANRLRNIAGEIPTYFAVDDKDVKRLLEQNGFSVVMTDPNCPSGTDRIAEANRKIGASHIINCPSDEPGVERLHIDLLADAVLHGAQMATLALNEFSIEEYLNPNRPKVVVGADGHALYFSRTGIPYNRTTGGKLPPLADLRGAVGLHQGFYAYTADMLERFTKMAQTPLEKVEGLEQLRVLEHGFPIRVRFNSFPTGGIDTPDDVAAYKARLGEGVVA